MARPRTSAKRFVDFVSSCLNPIYLIDDQRKITFANAACADWLGVDSTELIGNQVGYHGSDSKDNLDASSLCPPPEVFQGTPAEAILVRRHDDDSLSQRRAHFMAIGDGQESSGVLAVVDAYDQPASGNDQPAEDALESAELHKRLQLLVHKHAGRFRVGRLVGTSHAMRRVRAQLEVAVQTRGNLTIVGPAGSGREHLARTIHTGANPAVAGPLMPLSCALLEARLLQTTVLAFMNRCRELESASKATVLLLDGDQLSASAQAELSAFLNFPDFDLRILLTAQKSLFELAADGKFDWELATLLSTFEIHLPPLARRREDIPILVQQFVEDFNRGRAQQLSGANPRVVDILTSMPWEKNLSELSEVVELACRNAAGPWIQETDLPERVAVLRAAAEHPQVENEETIDLDAFLAEVESELIQRAMTKADGNKAKAARFLGINRARLLRRLEQLGCEEQHGPE